MSILQAIDVLILCGGEGTRLRCPMHPSMPKALAEIGNRPFIDILIENLRAQGFRKITLLAGYGAKHILSHIERMDLLDRPNIYVDEELNGTGPAIKAAMGLGKSDPVLICNGDTLIPEIDYSKMLGMHLSWDPMATIAEKDGIPAGAYLLSHRIKAVFDKMDGKYNLDDTLKLAWSTERLHYFQVESFVDMGTPESLEYFRGYHAGSVSL